MKKTGKSNVKVIALAIVAFFALGIVGLAVTQTQVGFAAPSKESSIGCVDFQKAMQGHPDAPAIQTEMQKEYQLVEKDFEEKAKTMNDQEKQSYAAQLRQRLQQKEAGLVGALQTKITEVVGKVAAAKGLSVVVVKDAVVFGGVDITDDVIKAYDKK